MLEEALVRAPIVGERFMARLYGAGRVLLAAGLLAVGFGLAGVAPAQTTKKDAAKAPDRFRQVVPINTVDGVNLVGTFYPSTNADRMGKDSPCVILLHKYGSDRSKGDWDTLARQLQGKGFNVVSFDFRGHGESRSVDPNFWKVAVNNDLVMHRPGGDRSKIDVKDFKPGYLPWLVNDILAVRKFLEVKNDSGEVSVNSLFLIGAHEGASLGMLFTATEWNRTYTTGFTALQTAGVQHLGGQDIAGCVWLSLVQRPNNISFDINAWARNPMMRERTPFYLIYGERDRGAAQTAEGVFNILTTGRQKNRLTQRYDVKGTDLAGQALLGQQALGVDTKIIDFMEKVLGDRKAIPWGVVDHDKNPLALVPALRTYGFSKVP
jgi:pimeloyl-ACP methyl ester carboxylesterase